MRKIINNPRCPIGCIMYFLCNKKGEIRMFLLIVGAWEILEGYTRNFGAVGTRKKTRQGWEESVPRVYLHAFWLLNHLKALPFKRFKNCNKTKIILRKKISITQLPEYNGHIYRNATIESRQESFLKLPRNFSWDQTQCRKCHCYFFLQKGGENLNITPQTNGISNISTTTHMN